MSLRNVLHILWRHKWLMLGIVFVTMLAVPLRLMGSQNEYTGTVKLLVTAPEQTSVALFGDYRTSTAADEINIVPFFQNQFVGKIHLGNSDVFFHLRVERKHIVVAVVQVGLPEKRRSINRLGGERHGH